MSHPHNAHRQHRVEHSRVAHLTKGYASGGTVHDDEAEDRSLVKGMVKKTALKGHKHGGHVHHAEGEKSHHRQDRPGRKRGGRAPKHKGNNVNVIIAGHGGAPPSPPMAGGVGPGMPPIPGPRPVPVPAPPGGPPGVGALPPPGMVPPGGPIRARGGRAYAKGDVSPSVKALGRIKLRDQMGGKPPWTALKRQRDPQSAQDEMRGQMERSQDISDAVPRAERKRGGAVSGSYGPGWTESERLKTKVQHTDGKDDGKDIGRGKPITYATGGPVEAPKGKAGMAPKLHGGGHSGMGRLQKAHIAARSTKGMVP